MSRKYRNPPIIEVLCEFQFISGQPWDMTIPGLLYEKIKGEFPEKQQKSNFGIVFIPKEEVIEQKVEVTQRIQFFNKDRTALIQLGPDLLTINHLKPYPTWEIFKPLIFDNLKIYQKIAKPTGMRRIGLRYINKINFDKTKIELSDYFNYYPFIPEKLPQTHETFNVRTEIPYEDGHDRLILALTSAIPEKKGGLSVWFDLNYVMSKPEDIAIEKVSDWVEKAHAVIEDAFEACVTDKSRNIFEEKK